MAFSIIIPVIDPYDRLVDSCAIQNTISMALHLDGDYELIIINNNSTIKCPKLTTYLRSLESLYANQVRVVEPEENMGTARGFNLGLRIAKPESEYLVFMSTDADIVDRSMLYKIKKVMGEYPNIGVAHPLSVFEDFDAFNFSSKYSCKVFHRMIKGNYAPEAVEIDFNQIQKIIKSVLKNKAVSMPFRSTPLTFAIYRRKMIDEIGSFDEGVQYGCYETDDICYRALLAGYQVARLNGVFVNHRRLYIRNLVLGERESSLLPHAVVIKQSTEWWYQKWKQPYYELYFKWRWGNFIFTMLLPYIRLRRIGSRLKAILLQRKGLLN